MITNTKVINDPLYTSIKKYLNERLKTITETSTDSEEISLAKFRYTDIKASDLLIDKPFPNEKDGGYFVNFISRTRGFCMTDIKLEEVEFKEILTDWKIFNREVHTEKEITDSIEAGTPLSGFIYIRSTGNYGYIVNKEELTEEDLKALVKNLFFSNIKFIEEETSNVHHYGMLYLTSENMGTEAIRIYK